jgi:CheY-like chemotaxis protein
MPHINGYQLAPMLRTGLLPAEVRIVAVTAWGSQQDREHSRAAGFDAHLLKPVGVDLLQATIRELLPES